MSAFFLARSELPADLATLDPESVRFCGPIDVEHDETGYLARALVESPVP